MDKSEPKDPKRYKFFGAMGSLSIHAVVLLLFFLAMLRTPIPPYPEGGGGPGMGIEVDLGAYDEGMGDIQPDEAAVPDDKKEEQATPEEEEELLSQEHEETDFTVKPKEPTKKTPKKTITKKATVVKTETKKATEAEKVSIPVLNKKALFPGKKSNASQGETGTAGDQGNPNGTKGANIYTGSGTGSGGGTGGGSGTGTGTGVGGGISFSLEGRNMVSLPKPAYTSDEQGTVVVEITVDKDGNVTKATPGVKGSTTYDERLLDEARKAALRARFSKKPDATVQKGTIRYHFMLQ
jgi:TonB family protein